MPHDSPQVLNRTELFASLDDSDIGALSCVAMRRNFAARDKLFNEGDVCTGLFIVVSGRVRIFKTLPNGREQVLFFEGPGAPVAEMPVFDGGRMPVSAAAVERAVTLFIPLPDMRHVCKKHPEVSLKLLEVAGKGFRRMVEILEERACSTVRRRLISWLLRREQPERCDRFRLAMSQEELAAEIGTVRELISRNLARLQGEGLISMDGRDMRILDRTGLEDELEEITD